MPSLFAQIRTGVQSRVRSFLTGKPTVGPKVRPQDDLAIGTLPVWAQWGRVGGPLTPDEVSAAGRAADLGDMRALVDLANDARHKDWHLHSILGTREMAAASLDWEFFLPERAPKKDRKIVEWLGETFDQAAGTLDPGKDNHDALTGFRGLLKHLQGGVYHGFAVSETLYEKRKGKLCPVAWSRLRQRRFAFDGMTGRLCWIDGTGEQPFPGYDLRRTFAPGKLVIHQPDLMGDDPQREGLSRLLLWAALFRNWGIRDWVALGELAWKPWRLGVYKKGSDQKDIDTLKSVLRQLTSSGVGVVPETTELKVEWPAGGGSSSTGPGHAVLFNTLGAEMSKAVLGQTLTTEQGARGSQALGRVHDSVRHDILEFDAQSIAETIRRDLIAPLVRMNFGRDATIPGFRFLTDEAADLKDFSTGVATLTKAGLRVPAGWVRDRLAIPEPKPGEDTLGPTEATPDPGTPSGSTTPPATPTAPATPPTSEGEPEGGTAPTKDPTDAPDDEARGVVLDGLYRVRSTSLRAHP